MENTELLERLERIERYALLAAKNVLSVNDLALLLGRSPKTIRNQVEEIPHYKDGKHIWFKRSEIEDWQCRIKHTPQTI